jgi:hypothetical protein
VIREGQVTLTRSDGRQSPLSGRVAELMEWLADHAAEVNAAEYGTLTFDMTRGGVKSKLLRTYPEMKRKVP